MAKWPKRQRRVGWREVERGFRRREPRVPVTLPKLNLPPEVDEEDECWAEDDRRDC